MATKRTDGAGGPTLGEDVRGVPAKQLENSDGAFLAAPPVPMVAQLGVAGLKSYNGAITEDFLSQLRGKDAAKLYGEMAANDGIVSAMLYACSMLIRKAKWRVESANDTPEAVAEREFVEGVMDDMSHSWPEFVEECTSFLTYGYAPFEIVWKQRIGPDESEPAKRSKFTDKRVGVRKLAIRAQDSVERWLFSPEDGGLAGMIQHTEQGQRAIIPIQKMLLFKTTSSKGNPEGRSCLRGSYVSYIRKKAVEDAEGRAALRAAGIVVLRIPGMLMSADADAEQQQAYAAYKTLVVNIAKDRQGGLILPSDVVEGKYAYELDYIVGDGRRPADMGPIIDRHNKTMATSILADFIFLGQQAVGSFALSSDKTQLFAAALGSYLRAMEEVLNRYLLPRLWKLNGLKTETMPKIKASEVEQPSLAELGQYVQQLTASGVPLFPDEGLEKYLRAVANLPEKQEQTGADQEIFTTTNVGTKASPKALAAGPAGGATALPQKASAKIVSDAPTRPPKRGKRSVR